MAEFTWLYVDSLQNGMPAPANLLQADLGRFRTLVNGNLTGEHFQPHSLIRRVWADGTIPGSAFTDGSVGANKVREITDREIALTGGGQLALDFDRVDGLDAARIGCLGIVERTIEPQSGIDLAQFRSAAFDYVAFTVDEVYSASEFGLVEFPARYTIVIEADAVPFWTHDYGVSLGSNRLTQPYVEVARSITNWSVWEQGRTTFRVGCRGLLVKNQDSMEIEAAFWKQPPSGSPAPPAFSLQDYVLSARLSVAVMGVAA